MIGYATSPTSILDLADLPGDVLRIIMTSFSARRGSLCDDWHSSAVPSTIYRP